MFGAALPKPEHSDEKLKMWQNPLIPRGLMEVSIINRAAQMKKKQQQVAAWLISIINSDYSSSLMFHVHHLTSAFSYIY